jgi:hypothetical protein
MALSVFASSQTIGSSLISAGLRFEGQIVACSIKESMLAATPHADQAI